MLCSNNLCDIGVNITAGKFSKSISDPQNWESILKECVENNVTTLILTGTSLEKSKKVLEIAEKLGNLNKEIRIKTTCGVHPHSAKTFYEIQRDNIGLITDSQGKVINESYKQILELSLNPRVLAIGECGLDYNRMLSPKEIQLKCFEQHILIACVTGKPLFVHEREAFDDTITLLKKYKNIFGALFPDVVIHCFTGSYREAREYYQEGFYLSVAGTICMEKRGSTLRKILKDSVITLDALMLETDCPYMHPESEKGQKRQNTRPVNVVDVANTVAECYGEKYETVCRITTENVNKFFKENIEIFKEIKNKKRKLEKKLLDIRKLEEKDKSTLNDLEKIKLSKKKYFEEATCMIKTILNHMSIKQSLKIKTTLDV